MDTVIDDLWEKIKRTCPIVMKEWLTCFQLSGSEEILTPSKQSDEDMAKREIKMTLENKENWKDRSRNFLLRLVSDDDNGYKSGTRGYKPRAQLALAFVHCMAKDPRFNDFLRATSGVHGEQKHSVDKVDAPSDVNENGVDVVSAGKGRAEASVRRGNGLLHEAAKGGRCADLKHFLSDMDIDVPNNIGETPLHLAAEFEHLDDVNILLEADALLELDHNDCTALHSAAMAVNPSAEIVDRLVGAMWTYSPDETINPDMYSLLNKQSKAAGNTALHIAAGNNNVTAEVIGKLHLADAKIRNSFGDTPFHVAAKSNNPNAILYMLDTFAPSKGGWDVDDVDGDRKGPTLLSICATSGNAEAVALLIQHGADLAQGVLHDIVIESVKCPEKKDKLLAVYRVIVDNVVTWRCLEENIKLKTKGTEHYNEFMRETMMWLITRPHQKIGNDVVQCAIDYGAATMLHEILNTKGVFRFDISDKKTLFDVTDFTGATMAKPDRTDSDDSSSLPSSFGRDYTEHFSIGVTYLRLLLLNYDEWRDENVLKEQPMRELTKPYFRFVKRCYFFIGMLQLLYMTFFTVHYMPTTCSLIDIFGLNSTGTDCSQHGDLSENTTSSPGVAANPETPHWFWLFWPIIVCVGITFSFLVDLLWISTASLKKTVDNWEAAVTRPTSERWSTKTLMAIGQMLPTLAFCAAVFVWYVRYGGNVYFFSYLDATSMVFLFGWIADFIFFSGMTQKFSVFVLVLKEILVKDIVMSFLLVFIATVVAFSFALHVLRFKELPSDDVVYLSATVYDVFSTALGIGEYIQNVREERAEIGLYFELFEVVAIAYICVTAIILLNVLIAILNHRYDKAKRHAENSWRFQMLQIALDLEKIPPIRKMFAARLRIDLKDLTACTCCCGLLCCYCRFNQVTSDSEKKNRQFVKVHINQT